MEMPVEAKSKRRENIQDENARACTLTRKISLLSVANPINSSWHDKPLHEMHNPTRAHITDAERRDGNFLMTCFVYHK
ncbi:hypothetical protein SUGI_0492970 [Cryptomeria japonica]|nr:hypothetical protein SUGI_0492970 [Cryptomeria japonica]